MSAAAPANPLASYALRVLLTLHGVMLLALFFQIAPHPPRAVAPFAMAPFLATVIGLAWSGIRASETGARAAPFLAGAVAVLSLVSFGPQKYIDPAFPEIWIAVIPAQLSILTIAYSFISARRSTQHVVA